MGPISSSPRQFPSALSLVSLASLLLLLRSIKKKELGGGGGGAQEWKVMLPRAKWSSSMLLSPLTNSPGHATANTTTAFDILLSSTVGGRAQRWTGRKRMSGRAAGIPLARAEWQRAWRPPLPAPTSAPRVSTFSTLTDCCSVAPTRDPFAIAHALAAASSPASSSPPYIGTKLHAISVKLGMAADTFTMNHLLIFYSRRGLLTCALELFDEMPQRNLISWTAMVSGSMRNGVPELGLGLFVSMLRSGFFPNEFSLARTLGACRSMAHAKLGLCLHGVAVKLALDVNPYVGSSLLLMYAKRECIFAAEQVFANIGCKDLACWNALLEAYVSNGCGYDAMGTVVQMHRFGIPSDMFTYISVLKACSIDGRLNFGQQLHGRVIQNMLESDTSVMNVLLEMYFKAGLKETAMDIFGKIRWKDTVSWNTVISCLSHDDDDEKAAAGYFVDMSRNGCKPNQVTFSVMLRLSGAKENTSLGLQIFGLAYCHGYSEDVLVVNAIINMLSRCGLLNSAYGFFSNLIVRNVVTWNEMIAGYGLHNCSEDVMRLFRSLLCFGARPDEFTYPAVLSAFQQVDDTRNHEQIHANILKHGFASYQFVSTSLIKAMVASGLVQSALKLIQDGGKLDLVSWGVIVSTFLKHGLNIEVLNLFNLFRGYNSENPDEFMLSSILNACANAALIRQCMCIHSLVFRTGHFRHFCVTSALVDAYAKSGDITAAESAFTAVSSLIDDTILYNTMLIAYANHGLIKEALCLYQEMTKLQLAPTPATFVAVISACNHLGLVEQGKLLFTSMLSAQGMNPTRANYACLIDLLARKGLLDEAKVVIESMSFQPWPAVWRSLMNGCRIHGRKDLSMLAAEHILRMVPSSDGAYVSLSNVYAEDGEWESADETRRRMAEHQVQKVQGYSSIEL